jgi:hypothetical protein
MSSGDDSDEEIVIDPPEDDVRFSNPVDTGAPGVSILPDLASATFGVLPDVVLDFPENDFRLRITIPSRILPDAMCAVNRLEESPTLLDLTLELKDNSFRTPPTLLQLIHPTFGPNFPGRALVSLALAAFFSPSYAVKPQYRRALYLLHLAARSPRTARIDASGVQRRGGRTRPVAHTGRSGGSPRSSGHGIHRCCASAPEPVV